MPLHWLALSDSDNLYVPLTFNKIYKYACCKFIIVTIVLSISQYLGHLETVEAIYIYIPMMSVYKCVYVCAYVLCVLVCMCVYVCMYMCVYVCVCVSVHVHVCAHGVYSAIFSLLNVL